MKLHKYCISCCMLGHIISDHDKPSNISDYKSMKLINNDYEESCTSCGIVLSKESMKKHSDKDCIEYMKMIRRYRNIIG